jgi:hypothetical protein
MNVNLRETSQHVEFEPNTYYAAFSAELEASAYPMWALVSHLSDSSTVELTRRVLNSCQIALQDWLDAIHFTHPHMVRNFISLRCSKTNGWRHLLLLLGLNCPQAVLFEVGSSSFLCQSVAVNEMSIKNSFSNM